MSDFFQTAPELQNPFDHDKFLQSFLKRFLSSEDYQKVENDLSRFGKRLLTDIFEMAKDVEENPPTLKQFDPWGRRVDEIVTAKGWARLDHVSAEEELISIGYKRPYQEASRVVQFAKIMLFHPSSAFYSCPLAMTDGAAKLLENLGLSTSPLYQKAFEHLTSNQPETFWTSGQWMTEKPGGSDVSDTETIARFENGHWRLYGVKWFTSATTSQMAMALARVEENGELKKGSKGLGLFYIELRDKNGELNQIQILRLKDKLGTKGLPTAELQLTGTIATMVAPAGEGVRTISSLFNITRIYNACTSMGSMRRLLFLAKDYAHKRKAFGHQLKDLPLHIEILAKLEVDYQAAFQLAFYVARLQGLDECPTKETNSKATKALLRLFTPIAKLVTAKINIEATSELVESFGGAGYIENTGIPKFLRDAQVLSIWEGTTNVLSLDVLRAIQKEGSFEYFIKEAQHIIDGLDNDFSIQKEELANKLKTLSLNVKNLSSLSTELIQSHARELAFSIGALTSAILMLEHASQTQREVDKLTALSFCKRSLISLSLDEQRLETHQKIAFTDF